jgi:DNA-binding transcriptional LysR family regulator
MEWVLLGLLAGIFFLVVTPWAALRAAGRIGPDWRLVAVASPAYLAANPPPQHPNELVAHNCINMRQSRAGGLYAWGSKRTVRNCASGSTAN